MLHTINREIGTVIALHQPEPFFAVGLHYEDFRPTSEREIEQLLAENQRRRGRPHTAAMEAA